MGKVNLDRRRNRDALAFVLFGCALAVGSVSAQENRPSWATRGELRDRFRDVTKALKWPPLSDRPGESEGEEFRLLMGSGTDWPGMVFRTSRTSPNATGSAAFWWVHGPLSQSIRNSFTEGPSKTCKRMAHAGNVEVCELARHEPRAGWNSIWASSAAANAHSLVLGRPPVSPSDKDTVVAAIQWSDGSQVGELFATRDTSGAGGRETRAVVCLVQLLLDKPDLPAAEGRESQSWCR